MPKGDKKFLGYVLEKDPRVDMWFNEGGPGEASIALNKHSEASWSITVTNGNASLIGVGKTEREAREKLTSRMRDTKKLLECFNL